VGVESEEDTGAPTKTNVVRERCWSLRRCCAAKISFGENLKIGFVKFRSFSAFWLAHGVLSKMCRRGGRGGTEEGTEGTTTGSLYLVFLSR
jgi:hypothetical protein